MGPNYPRAPTAKIQELALRDITDSSAAPTSGRSAEYPFAQPGALIYTGHSQIGILLHLDARQNVTLRLAGSGRNLCANRHMMALPRRLRQFSRGRPLPYPTHLLQQCRRSRLLSGTVAHSRTAGHALRVSPHHTYETQRPATRANGECASELTSDSQPSASLESDAGARGTLISRDLVTAFT
jgi:hypothetical protein